MPIFAASSPPIGPELAAGGEPPAEAAVREQLERVLQSAGFRSAGVLRHLLGYLAEKCLAGEADSLKEYSIGIDALGKPASFDPRQESVVRMHTARLRQKLADYYRGEGANDPVWIDLPKGGFRLTFERRPVVASESAPEAAAGWSRRERRLGGALGLALLALAVALAFGFVGRPGREAIPAEAGWTPELKELWGPLVAPGRRVAICVSTPLFVNLPGFGVIRDSSLNDWDELDRAKNLERAERAIGSGMSSPSYEYTGVGTAAGAFQLGQFLAAHRQSISVTSSNRLSWHEIAEESVVFVGQPEGIHQAEDLPLGASLVLEPRGIRNRQPAAGEPDFIPDERGPAELENGVSHALISRLPAMDGHGAILMLLGNQPSAVAGAVQAFTNPAVARALVTRLRARTGKTPEFFQAVLNVKAMDQVPVEVSYVLHREVGEAAPAAKPAAK